MWAVLLAFVYLVLGLLTLVVALLCLPYVLGLRASTGPAAGVALEVRPFTETFPWALRLGGASRSAEPGPPTPEVPDRKAESDTSTKSRKRGAGSGDRAKRMLRAAPRLIGGLLGQLRLLRLAVQGEYGTGDPADTGALAGIIEPLNHIPLGRRVLVDLRPRFDAACLDASADCVLRIVPVRLFGPLIRFGWQVFVVRR